LIKAVFVRERIASTGAQRNKLTKNKHIADPFFRAAMSLYKPLTMTELDEE
jgi:hypothetical protein